jgi:hypothetical protein
VDRDELQIGFARGFVKGANVPNVRSNTHAFSAASHHDEDKLGAEEQ